MWFELEMSNAFLKNKQFGPGLRTLKFVEKHFSDLYED